MAIDRLEKRARAMKPSIALPHVLNTNPKDRYGQKPAFYLPDYAKGPIRARQTRKDKGIPGA